ncbi:MAG: STN domain-containing protein, partial [Bacteroidales bacterium]
MMMKRQISLFLICFLVAICSVNGQKASAQTTNATNQTISVSVSNARVESVIDQIEKQTKYLFVYNKSLVNVDRIVSVNLKNATIEQTLSTLFKNSDV